MDISSLTNISSNYIEQAAENYQAAKGTEDQEFGTVLESAMNLINETNNYQNDVESEQIRFALGESTSTHELAAAQKKASLTLQYTVAVRDKIMEAYKEIMNMNI